MDRALSVLSLIYKCAAETHSLFGQKLVDKLHIKWMRSTDIEAAKAGISRSQGNTPI